MTQSELQPQLGTLDDVLPLRAQVLRPGQDPSAAIFDADRDATSESHHWLIRDHQQVLSVASTYLRPLPAEVTAQPDLQSRDPLHAESQDLTSQVRWRQLRGMATAPSAQGQGHGRALLRAICAPTTSPGEPRTGSEPREGSEPNAGVVGIWCNARRSAVGFYESCGFVRRSSEFEIVGVGPHYVMSFRVT